VDRNVGDHDLREAEQARLESDQVTMTQHIGEQATTNGLGHDHVDEVVRSRLDAAHEPAYGGEQPAVPERLEVGNVIAGERTPLPSPRSTPEPTISW
jgi:hypothetical protein